MPQFTPGESKTAKAPITVKPAGLSCECELYLVSDSAKVATSGLKAFTSTGAAQDITFPITMPSTTGTYKVNLDIFASGILIGAYQAIENVIIAVPVIPEKGYELTLIGTSSNPIVTRLEGTVRNGATGLPIPGAGVSFVSVPYPGILSGSTIADSLGNYVLEWYLEPIDGWADGPYDINIAGIKLNDVSLGSGKVYRLDAWTKPYLPVDIPNPTIIGTYPSEDYSIVRGKVTDKTTGMPIANAIVGLYYYKNYYYEESKLLYAREAKTDADGNYQVTYDGGLPVIQCFAWYYFGIRDKYIAYSWQFGKVYRVDLSLERGV